MVTLYADDTVIYHYNKVLLQKNLKLISNWCNANLLTVNVNRSNWMRTRVCGKEVDNMEQDSVIFSIRNIELKDFELYNYLDVHINADLNLQSLLKKMITQKLNTCNLTCLKVLRK